MRPVIEIQVIQYQGSGINVSSSSFSWCGRRRRRPTWISLISVRVRLAWMFVLLVAFLMPTREVGRQKRISWRLQRWDEEAGPLLEKGKWKLIDWR